jgi:hypothetical protein
MSRTSADQQQRGPTHRHAAAGVQSVQLSLQGPTHSISAGIGPEGGGGHGAAGGEKAETKTRRLLLLLMLHGHGALKREGGRPSAGRVYTAATASDEWHSTRRVGPRSHDAGQARGTVPLRRRGLGFRLIRFQTHRSPRFTRLPVY